MNIPGMQEINIEVDEEMDIYASVDDKNSHDVLERTEDTKRDQISQQKVKIWCLLIHTNNHQFHVNNQNTTEERDQLLTNYTKLTEDTEKLLAKMNYFSKLSEQLKEKIEPWTLLHEGWIYYQFHFYYMSSERKNWAESRRYCRDRGADLIIINNREEQDFVKNTFNKTVWIGLSDSDEEGEWKWVDGSTLTTSFWASTEPNSYLGDEDCVVTYLKWADYPSQAHCRLCATAVQEPSSLLPPTTPLLPPQLKANYSPQIRSTISTVILL
ncbi:CD209 antigen-like [Triplophysa dalaica]|uniref:CD209 antigen-like n=1 Tax=Triplophysa dalaica TaxID=1582913 RepID=UPI0024E03FA0|nr:CD209 antigen-like [Triplophysa dalaica]